MSFYETKDQICAKLGIYLQEQMVSRGLDTCSVIQQYREISAAAKDSYSSAILMNGVVSREAPLFANTPRVSEVAFKHLLIDRFAEVFYELQIPDTQQQASIFARRLRKSGVEDVFSETQLLCLEKIPAIKDLFSKASEWLILARVQIVAMCDNLPALQAVTEEEKEFSKLTEFDWYYDYSDSPSVWRGGKERHAKASAEIVAALERNPNLRKVLEVIAKNNRLTVTFFTGKAI